MEVSLLTFLTPALMEACGQRHETVALNKGQEFPVPAG